MFNMKFIISVSIFISFLIFTSVVKNKTRVIEKHIFDINKKIFNKKKDINETQLDFYYLSSPAIIEKKLEKIGMNNYQPIKYSNIFFNISEFNQIQNKISNLKSSNEKKIRKNSNTNQKVFLF